jgi:catechol 2,3-dioxygenase-like lactoylglutathione lyase family enzyme
VFKEANVTLMVRDMERTVRFYTATLGLRLRARYGDHFAQVEAPGTIIALHPASDSSGGGGAKEQGAGSDRMSIGFAVSDLQATMDDLKGKGVVFTRVTDDKQVRLAFFTDPDGTPLYLSQNKWG